MEKIAHFTCPCCCRLIEVRAEGKEVTSISVSRQQYGSGENGQFRDSDHGFRSNPVGQSGCPKS